MTATSTPPAAPAGGRRHARAALEGLLGTFAAVLLPLGVMLILLGWYGASQTTHLFEQVPYLISGGLVGLALVVAGAVAYFTSWVAHGTAAQKHAAAVQQRSAEEMTSLLREIRDQLAALSPVGDIAPPRRATGGGLVNGSPSLVATSAGSMLHRPDCRVVAGRGDVRAVSVASGLKPCGLCHPLATSRV